MSAYIQFGAGLVYTNPNAGNLATNPTPLKGLTIQDITLDVQADVKELRGQYQFPDDTAIADKKGTGKFQVGRKDLTMFNQNFFADTIAAGGTSVATNVAGTIPASTPFTITPTVPGSGTFSEDLGVSYSGTGVELIKVASGPTTGQYSVSAGVYTFAAADEGLAVLISFAYTVTTPGSTYQVNQQTLGYGPQVEIFIVDTYKPTSGGIFSTIRVYAAKFTKVTLGNKRVDYSMPEMDYSYFAASSGRVLDLYSNVG